MSLSNSSINCSSCRERIAKTNETPFSLQLCAMCEAYDYEDVCEAKKEAAIAAVAETTKQKKDKITLVTAFFNLNKSNPQVLATSEYYKHARWIMQINLPLVVYCDEETVQPIRAMREEYQLLDKTDFKVQHLREFKLFQLFEEKVRENRARFWATRDARAPVESHLLCNSKMQMVSDTIERNPFQTEYFGWLDFGLAKCGCTQNGAFTPERFTKMLQETSVLEQIGDRVALQVMGDVPASLYQDDQLYQYYSSYPWIVCGNFWTCGTLSGLLLASKVLDIFERHTRLGVGHGEEPLFAELLDQEPELFHCRYGDYQDVLINYGGPKQNVDYILSHVLGKLREHNKHWRGIQCAKALWRQFQIGALPMSSQQVMQLCVDWFICAYYCKSAYNDDDNNNNNDNNNPKTQAKMSKKKLIAAGIPPEAIPELLVQNKLAPLLNMHHYCVDWFRKGVMHANLLSEHALNTFQFGALCLVHSDYNLNDNRTYRVKTEIDAVITVRQLQKHKRAFTGGALENENESTGKNQQSVVDDFKDHDDDLDQICLDKRKQFVLVIEDPAFRNSWRSLPCRQYIFKSAS
jgi:hypothetical protein